MKVFRRGHLRVLTLGGVAFLVLLYVYFHSSSSDSTTSLTNPASNNALVVVSDGDAAPAASPARKDVELSGLAVAGQKTPNDQCPALRSAVTDVNTVAQFPLFEFQPAWMRGREYWDTNFEKRYLKRRAKWQKLPLKVFLMPHSHNDPGWLKTYEEYFFQQSSKILQNMVTKLMLYPKMTFVWAEVSFLTLWYERAHPTMRHQLLSLLKEGRLEVLTGGWVMPDEASTHLYALVDQMVIGHQWLNRTLGIKPAHGWSIDPFGHGAAVPYLLHEASISGTVIQRIHYAWKQWLAEQQLGDFKWRQTWDADGDVDILVHNRPFDIYSIKHSCGPHLQICLEYDFRKVPGEYTEYSIKSFPIDESNVKLKAELLLEQYGRQGSLVPHNVVLIPIGDDFRYDHATEWDQQYTNYQMLADHINSNPSKYHATIEWGTVKDYFKEVKARMKDFPTLQGDFFVYSDIFTEGRPAYWSGYYTTRPFFKLLDRQLQAVLRSAEILYTWAWARAAEVGITAVAQLLEKDYEKLVKARENLALFQHHDGITGTSKAIVMRDYAVKLFLSYHDSIAVSARCAEFLLMTRGILSSLQRESNFLEHLQPDFERPSYDSWPNKIPIITDKQMRQIVIFNSLAQQRIELVKILVTSTNFRLTDEHGHDVLFQINPVWNDTGNGLLMLTKQFEVFFMADLPPLSLATYTIHHSLTADADKRKAIIFSNYYAPSPPIGYKAPFDARDVLPGDIQIDSDCLKLLFDGSTGMLRSVTNKKTGKVTQTAFKFAAYPSAQFKSGAYLFQPDPNARDPEEDVLAGARPRIFIHSGPVASELTVMFGAALMHTTRIFHTSQEPLQSAIYIENIFNFASHYNSTETPGFPPNYRETELFMRISTDIDNGANPVFYSDQSGLHMQKRVKVEKIGIQGNYFPITTAAFIEDEAPVDGPRRMTLLTDHGQGAASWQQGWLEVMVERRTNYDDARGMGEGVTDQKRTMGRHWLLIEDLESERGGDEVARLSVGAHYLSNALNYPVDLYVADGLESHMLNAGAHFISRPLPCSLHLLGMKILPVPQYPGLMPSMRALMHIHNQSPACSVRSSIHACSGLQDSPPQGTELTIGVKSMQKSDLTGTRLNEEVDSLSKLRIPHHQIRTLVLTLKDSSYRGDGS
ncbi:alpha-mannosidase 2 [Hyalella azteca]|uniref:Alpha-mannosidase n=1 Tax=Hyalella azteca TaxID=294128 RepID=A0A8B7NHZ3_HYAAZ|nr:alpha-mannosidase 2 [Hyalella azteca]